MWVVIIHNEGDLRLPQARDRQIRHTERPWVYSLFSEYWELIKVRSYGWGWGRRKAEREMEGTKEKKRGGKGERQKWLERTGRPLASAEGGGAGGWKWAGFAS